MKERIRSSDKIRKAFFKKGGAGPKWHEKLKIEEKPEPGLVHMLSHEVHGTLRMYISHRSGVTLSSELGHADLRFFHGGDTFDSFITRQLLSVSAVYIFNHCSTSNAPLIITCDWQSLEFFERFKSSRWSAPCSQSGVISFLSLMSSQETAAYRTGAYWAGGSKPYLTLF